VYTLRSRMQLKTTKASVAKKEVALYVFAFGLVVYFWSGPILEGFGINLTTNYFNFFPNIAGRPLALVPQFISTSIGGNSKTGYFFAGMMFVLCKSILAYLITQQRKRAEFLILFATLMFLPPWFGFFNERYFPAHLALILTLFRLYFALFKKSEVLTILFGFLSGLAYPPIAFASLYTSLIILVLYQREKQFRKLFISESGTILFLIYYLFIKLNVDKSYEAQSTSSFSFDNVVNLYQTTFFTDPFKGMLIVLFICLMFSLTTITRLRRCFTAIFVLFTIPFSAFGYAGNSLHVNDPDRILFPISACILLMLISFLAFEPIEEINWQKTRARSFLGVLTFALCLITLFTQLIQWSGYYKLNGDLIETVSKRLNNEPTNSLLIIDKTDFYGDVYTLLNSADVLSLALIPKMDIGKTVICNSHKKNSFTIASKYPIPGAADCANVELSQFDKVLLITSISPLNVSILNSVIEGKADHYLE
jgi:hypothetical protein